MGRICILDKGDECTCVDNEAREDVWLPASNGE